MKIIRGLQHLWQDESGTIMLESAIVFPVQMFLTLSIVQVAFILAALNVVNYAAFQAARTAAVKLILESLTMTGGSGRVMRR